MSCPSATSVVPLFTAKQCALTLQVLLMTTGRKLSECGQTGVRQSPCTGGLRIGPPAEAL